MPSACAEDRPDGVHGDVKELLVVTRGGVEVVDQQPKRVRLDERRKSARRVAALHDPACLCVEKEPGQGGPRE